jgi:trans-2,3-dihydro-3-hydroxyanthranilate isomerase
MLGGMPDLRFLHYDVFTASRFEGNQLAVFTDARGVAANTMQTIAREMNFSESTFILPAEHPDTDIRMRIFTPASELPMAGHPTIGSTFALAHEGVIAAGRHRFVFGLGVGPTPVELHWNDGALAFAWMDQRRPEFRAVAASLQELTRAIGVDHESSASTGLPAEEISCGVPFIFVPLATREAVDAAEPDSGLLRRLPSAFPGNHVGVFVFTTDGATDDVTVYSRMFAPGLGVLEDPATGGASGPLGCYLVKHRLVPPDRADRIVSLQGVAMGRSSRIHIAIGLENGGEMTRVQVGGQAVLVGQGSITV